MKKLNNIKIKTKEAGATSVLLSVLLDVNSSTVSGWNSNSTQPSLVIVDELADFLEFSNSEFIVSTKRYKTGLAKATQKEYKRLIDSGVVQKVPSNDGNGTEMNNPILVKAIRDFVSEYKKNHNNDPAPYPVIIDKKLADILDEEIEGVKIFICDGPNIDALSFQVVTVDEGRCIAIASFNELKDAENYVDLALRGYVTFDWESEKAYKKNKNS